MGVGVGVGGAGVLVFEEGVADGGWHGRLVGVGGHLISLFIVLRC